MNTRVRLSERVLATEAMSDSPQFSDFVEELCGLSLKALPAMYRPADETFVQTVRRDREDPTGLRKEGINLRYAAIVALGLAVHDEQTQRSVLDGRTAAELARRTAHLAAEGGHVTDLGACALAAWAMAEICGEVHDTLFDRLLREIQGGTPQPTVDFSWALTTLVAADSLGDFRISAARAAKRLLASQGGKGIFGHHLPREVLGRHRAHVGCFADQVYPIQALARYFAMTGDRQSLEAANACARRIVELQGSAGQWWWHYDARTGGVVEGFPVYSVHQHAMAPMALFDLFESGGDDHRAAILAGLAWMNSHPESTSELIDPNTGAIWRKIGRKEPRKAVRSLRAVSTAVSPKLKLSILDVLFKPGVVDYECRPYELGWLLYGWLATRAAQPPQNEAADRPTGHEG